MQAGDIEDPAGPRTLYEQLSIGMLTHDAVHHRAPVLLPLAH